MSPEDQLRQAVREGDAKLIKAAIDRGGNVNADTGSPSARTADRNIPLLHYAIVGQKHSAVRALLQHGADVNKATAHGETALMYAIREEHRWPGLVQAILAKGADVNYQAPPPAAGPTSLVIALESGNRAIAKRLLAQGADPNQRSQWKYTPLMVAARIGDVEMTKLLLARGADMHATNAEHDTALKYAVRRGRYGVAEVLLKRGAKK